MSVWQSLCSRISSLGFASPSRSTWRTSRAAHRKPEQLPESNSHKQGWEMTSLPYSTPTPVTIGIDVAKAMLDIAIGVNAPPLSLTNDSEGFETLLGQLATHRVALVVMEATGGLETAAAAVLQAAAYAVAVINPRQARD